MEPTHIPTASANESQSQEAQRSPLPWVKQGIVVRADNYDLIAVMSYAGIGIDTARANAEHIVRCVNSHDDLLAALTAALDMLFDCDNSEADDVSMQCKAAIAKAEGR